VNAHRVIERLWARQPGRYICLSTKNAAGPPWHDYLFTTVDLSLFVAEHVRENIYFAPMKFDAPCRWKEHAVLPSLLWADMDAASPFTCAYEPTIAITSSPKRYVGLWVTDRAVTEELNKRMTYFIGADKGGWDLVQVLRLPGTLNHKYDPPARHRRATRLQIPLEDGVHSA
jgi:hypothetical protein